LVVVPFISLVVDKAFAVKLLLNVRNLGFYIDGFGSIEAQMRTINWTVENNINIRIAKVSSQSKLSQINLRYLSLVQATASH